MRTGIRHRDSLSDIETYDMLYANDAVRRLIGGPYEGRKCYEAITGVDAPCEFCTNNLLKRDSYYAWTRYNENLGGYYALKDRLKVMSFTDSLTGLKNRNRFIADMETLDAQGPRKGFGVAYLDLNGLKEANDSEGHAQGDSMLSMVADVLRSAFDGSSVYRLGGDEFLAINSSTSESAFMRQARDACERLDERSCPVAAGLFYAVEPCLVDYAVSCADRRMYKQKQNYYEKHPALDPRRAARNGFKIK
ncbi:GGDEF domain-containing protein [Raoultibacter massiliensis]|uniref:GGDEF domain-containing protein n=1 Tax=Raoultibacter massiliensis TaxID=1852371 RepID=A0ABV1JBP3_9ACTN|nr:GGDEF domain-containing protein [Raoultibacter massiliensis]